MGRKTAVVLLTIAGIFLFGAEYFSLIGGCITAMLVLTLLFLSLANREERQNP